MGCRQGGRVVSHALAIVEKADHVCYRYRVRAFEPELNRRGIKLAVFPLPSHSVSRLVQFAKLPRLDSILIQRKLLTGLELKLLRRVADRLVFDFDDAVFQRDSHDRRGPFSRKRASRFRSTMAMVDVVIAGNDYLADAASKAGARADKIVVIPTCIDTSLYKVDARTKPASEGVELVWVGSSSTLRGLEARRNLFERLVEAIPGIKLRVICDRFPDLGELPIIAVPWSEATEADEISQGDIGISWIPNDPWSRGKCGLKILQYQAAGLPVLANPVGVHPEMIQPGRNGFLPETDDEWVSAIQQLAADQAGRREMGRQSRSDVERGYSVTAWEETFAATLGSSWSAAEASTLRAQRRIQRADPVHPRGTIEQGGNSAPSNSKTGQIEVHG